MILEDLDDVVSENQNAEWIQYRFTLLEQNSLQNLVFGKCTQYHQCSLFGIADTQERFWCYLKSCFNCIKMLEEILTNKNTDLLKIFNSLCADIVKKIDYQMRLTVSGSTRKRRAQDRFSNDKDQFYETVIKPFVSALIVEIKGVFDMPDIPIVLILMRLDPISILEESDIDEDLVLLKTLHDFYDFYGNVRT